MPLTELVASVTELSQISGSVDAFVDGSGAGNRSTASALSPSGELLSRREDVFILGARATTVGISAHVLREQPPDITVFTNALPVPHQTSPSNFGALQPLNRTVYSVDTAPRHLTVKPRNNLDVLNSHPDHDVPIDSIPASIPPVDLAENGRSTHSEQVVGFYETGSSNLVASIDDVSGSLDLTVGLYDADSDALITQIAAGSEISARILAGRKVTIAAVIAEDHPLLHQIESIAFNLNEGQVTQIESLEPYALFGDRNGNLQGNDISFLAHGENSITFDLYSKNGANGTLLGTVTRSFTIA